MVMVFVTAPVDKGEEIAKKLLEERVAACVSLASVKSMYWWKGSIETDNEVLLIVKTRRECVEKLMKILREIHPYEVPEIAVVDVSKVNAEYLRWLIEETRCP